MTLEDFELEIA